MEREELIAKVEEIIGLKLQQQPNRSNTELVAVSPNGSNLFTVSIFESIDGSGWQFGGHGSLLSEHWATLCRLGT